MFDKNINVKRADWFEVKTKNVCVVKNSEYFYLLQYTFPHRLFTP